MSIETRAEGNLGLGFYKRYLGAMRGVVWVGPFLLITILAENFFASGFKWMVAFWVEGCANNACVQKPQFEVTARRFFESASHKTTFFCFLLFVTTALVVKFFSWVGVLGFLSNGGRLLHDDMVESLGHVRVTFFDEHPTGRIVRRFSGDYAHLVREIPNFMSDIAASLAELLWITAIVLFQAPLAALACVPCGVLYFYVQLNFRPTAREVQRLSKVLETPIWSLFTETMSGYQTIRCYGRAQAFASRFRMLAEQFGYGALTQSRLTRWMNVRLKLISELFTLSVTLYVVWSCSFNKMSVGTAGFLMSLTIGLDASMQWLTRSLSMLETSMVSVERVLEYRSLENEVTNDMRQSIPEIGWPHEGRIEFINYSMSYREGLPRVLDGFSAVFQPGERTGIIGRTGSGKSSIFQSLFQMVHQQAGQILVDGIDIATVPIDNARAVFGVIPQEPHLFSGTLRYNLDRVQRYSDDEIWSALETVRLADFVKRLPGQLDYLLVERGANLSVGQRQLFCMARAILSRAKIILMDEATASVDLETEKLIHDALIRGFHGRTILIIAHRLQTVRECSQTLVVRQGRVLDCGSTGSVLNRINVSEGEL